MSIVFMDIQLLILYRRPFDMDSKSFVVLFHEDCPPLLYFHLYIKIGSFAEFKCRISD